MDFKSGGRLVVPFVIWSLLYSGISLAKDIHHGVSVNWLGYVYRFVVGKAATPFYYIVVLIQLTVITPWLVNVVKDSKTIKNLLWLITPCYLLYIYVWNLMTGYSPRLYETLFPAWFGFYYLGINVRCGLMYSLLSMYKSMSDKDSKNRGIKRKCQNTLEPTASVEKPELH